MGWERGTHPPTHPPLYADRIGLDRIGRGGGGKRVMDRVWGSAARMWFEREGVVGGLDGLGWWDRQVGMGWDGLGLD